MTREDALLYQEKLLTDIWHAEQHLARARYGSLERLREQKHLDNRKAFYQTLERALNGRRAAVTARSVFRNLNKSMNNFGVRLERDLT